MVWAAMRFSCKLIDIRLGRMQVLMHAEDAEELGLHPRDRVRVSGNGQGVTAIVDTTDSVVDGGMVGIFPEVCEGLGLDDAGMDGAQVDIVPAERPRSVQAIRKKMDGQELTKDEVRRIVEDIVDGSLSDIELAAYVTAVEIEGMTMDEIRETTIAMVETGETIDFGDKLVFDKHSVGGVPGNKISFLIVPIVAAAGLLIPKTSSRAITGAGGTADIMEVMCDVTLSADEIKRVGENVGGVLCWGGGVNLAPADDIIIRVEYPLSIDPYGQVLASVMAKKKAVGADYLVLDLPTGPNTKVPDLDYARKLSRDFIDLGDMLDIQVECAVTYGGQPVGQAVGPALEAREALLALEGGDAPGSLIEKSCAIAGILLEMGQAARRGEGKAVARKLLESGDALDKFQEIVAAQRGPKSIASDDITVGDHHQVLTAEEDAYLSAVDNKAIIAIARAAGAPRHKGAGVVLHKKRGDRVDKGDKLLTVHADNEHKLQAALDQARRDFPVEMEGMLLMRIPDYRTP